MSDAAAYCAGQVRERDNDRFVCSLFAPPAERTGLIALYAFNLEIACIRERVREPMLGRIRVQWWRDALDRLYAGGPPIHPVLDILAPVVSRYGLDRRYFADILTAYEGDFEDDSKTGVAELVAYAEATSATLCALGLQILGAPGSKERAAARDVGIAWGLACLLRAAPLRGQPSSIGGGGIGVSRISGARTDDQKSSVIRQLAGAAGDHLKAARRHRLAVDRRALPVLLLATLADDYLAALARRDFDPLTLSARPRPPRVLIRLALNRLRRRY